MSALDLLDEREESLVDHLCIRIRERVEYEGVNLSVAEDLCEIRLELTVSAAAEAEELESCAAHELHRVAHAGAACADSVSV